MKITWKRTIEILLLILVLGSGLRFISLGHNSFVADEFLDMNSSYGYLQTGEWKAWDFNFGKPAEMNVNVARDERAFVYKWQVAQVFKFLPPTEASARTISALWGIFTLLVMFWTAWFYTRKKSIGLIAAFLFAVSISGIIFDRRLRMYAMFFPLFLGMATAAYAFLESEYRGRIAFFKTVWEKYSVNLVYLPLFLILAWLSFSAHQLSATIVPIGALYLGIMSWLAWRKTGGLKNKYSVLFIGGLALGIILLFTFQQAFASFSKELTWLDDHYSYFGYLLSDFAHPLLGATLIVLGIRYLADKLKRPKEALWLTLSFAVPLIMAVFFWNRNAGPQYIFFAQSFVLLLSAVGVYALWRFARENTTLLGKKAGLIALGLALLLVPNYGYFLSENNTYHETSSGSNPNYRKVFGYFKKHKTEGEVLITRNFRNYYFAGAKVPVYDFGGELSTEKFSLAELNSIVGSNPHGWLILSTNDYDYISNDAEQFFKKNMERVSHSELRGPIEVYRW